MTPLTAQIVIAFVFGVVFVVTLIVLAIKFPHPTPFQYNVFRVVLSLAAAGVAAMIPGFIDIEVSATMGLLIRAGGALAVFVMVFFFNPAQLASEGESRNQVPERDPESSASSGIPRDRTKRFITLLNSLEEVGSEEFSLQTSASSMDKTPPPRIIDVTAKERLLRWAETIDDELLLVTEQLQSSSRKEGVTLRTIQAKALPLGAGRSVDQLIDELLAIGVLAPSTEHIPPGTYHEQDAKANPSWNFGRMFRATGYYLKLFAAHE